MADPEGTRKLEAILAADVAGYSRLMQDDDEATVASLEAYRVVFREKIQAHRGRVVDMTGDSVLAVFDAATDAVRAAFEIQAVLVERNEALPEKRRMRFRIVRAASSKFRSLRVCSHSLAAVTANDRHDRHAKPAPRSFRTAGCSPDNDVRQLFGRG